VRSAG
jgi:PucR family transcriptional regulator, purine catabolism regulatory protein